MKRLVLCALGAAAFVKANSAETPPSCAPTPKPAAYVAGVDAEGRPVTPADTGAITIKRDGDIVLPKIRLPGNPALKDVRVAIDAAGLSEALTPPACPPVTSNPNR